MTDLNAAFENFKLKQELRDVNLISASIKHEVVTPLRCLAVMADDAPNNADNHERLLRTVYTTSNLCLSYVEGQMDQLFLENGHFEPNIQHHRLFDEVIRPVMVLFELQSKM